ncbi:DNA-binding protein [Paenibacillus kyungheensis]
MNHKITLRDELEHMITEKGYSLSQFSKISGINRGILSATLNGNPPKPISIKQLDQMTKALGKEEGCLYEQFMSECFEEGKANWRRVRSLLIRCAELELIDILKRALYLLLENLTYIQHIFDLAEELYPNKNKDSILYFYTCIIEHERDSHSERFAISQYRVFRYSIGIKLENNFRAAIQFAPFRRYLPPYLLLDALVNLSNISYTMQDWKNVKKYSDELKQITQLMYTHKENKHHKPERDLVVYYGKSYLLKLIALTNEGKYLEAEKILPYLQDFDWLGKSNEKTLLEIEKFKLYAKFHKYNLKLLQGDQNYLNEYVLLVKNYTQEQLASLLVILKASNLHNWDIDYLLNDFYPIIYPKDIIEYLISRHETYYIETEISQYISIYYQLALYQCNKGTYDDKLEKILLALESTVTKYNKSRILDCLELFKKLRLISKNGN